MKLVVGTRGSALAVAQTKQVLHQLSTSVPDLEVEMRIIKTTGDRLVDVATADLPMGKGVFTAELENALLRDEVDLAVHSLKDLPTQMGDGLALGAIPAREDYHDVLVVKNGSATTLEALPDKALVATGSERRRRQLQNMREDLQTTDVRGNIDTRLRKLRENEDWAGLVLAAAGLNRLGPDTNGLSLIPLVEMLPAPGQGALGLQIRDGDQATLEILQKVHSIETAACVTAERAFLEALGGGCEWPIGALAHIQHNALHLRGIYWRDEEETARTGQITGDIQHPNELGAALASRL